MLTKTKHYMKQANLIGGEWVQADSGATQVVINPANGLEIGRVPTSGVAETERAIAAAAKAFETFRKTTANERAAIMRRMYEAMLDTSLEYGEQEHSAPALRYWPFLENDKVRLFFQFL